MIYSEYHSCNATEYIFVSPYVHCAIWNEIPSSSCFVSVLCSCANYTFIIGYVCLISAVISFLQPLWRQISFSTAPANRLYFYLFNLYFSSVSLVHTYSFLFSTSKCTTRFHLQTYSAISINFSGFSFFLNTTFSTLYNVSHLVRCTIHTYIVCMYTKLYQVRFYYRNYFK